MLSFYFPGSTASILDFNKSDDLLTSSFTVYPYPCNIYVLRCLSLEENLFSTYVYAY